MAAHSGIDSANYFGQATLSWLMENTNLSWCGYYLAPAPSHHDTSWMGKRSDLINGGWGLAPVYVGQQLSGPGSHKVTGPQGALDGAQAAALMRQEGFAQGSYVYLDLEDGAPFVSPRADYVAQWIKAVATGGYQCGVYCSHNFAQQVLTAHPGVRIWAFRVATAATHPFTGLNFPQTDPAGCGCAGAYMWQLEQNCTITLPMTPQVKLQVDLNTSLAMDPSAP